MESMLDFLLDDFKSCTHSKGTYYSEKMQTSYKYANDMEILCARWLDECPNVKEFFYENVKIPYVLNGQMKVYKPDFAVTFNGRKEIWELKCSQKTEDKEVLAKAEAAREYAKSHGYEDYRILTYNDLRDLISM